MRPLNLTISALTIMMIAHALGAIGDAALIVSAIMVVLSYNAAANVLNDYMDQETDALNRPDRPLSKGEVKPKTALIMALLLFAIGTACAFMLSFEAKLVAIGIALPLLILYSLRLKKLPLVGNIVVALMLALTFLFAGFVFNNVEKVLVPAALAFGLTLVRELVKDIADMDGDKAASMRTFPIAAGMRLAVSLSVFLAMITGLGALLPYRFGLYGEIYLLILVFGVEIPMMTSVVLLVKNPAISTAVKSAQILKFSTIAGLLALYFGMLYAV
ncbi:MAG: geranylgeranylglycerol-phosphate geranylgeranyltransferase [Candidatus Marinimicrobia bacterium]|jgi:4-hydroxybenzoate polyprenyltransferase|nr:geranylgeranylglycerol-phosphate geranylgeranyltransferase [Candidatus Neomarinimicrobiota bacterium]MDP7071561.1 geranylgeranylglycerol-phosphate geranylgeranyltransferase [Candidatus Neomarinimicrobiota bacterium]